MIAVSRVRSLRRIEGGELARRYAVTTRDKLFAAGGVPVVIAARNEQDDLPATLLALSWSTVPVKVWVALNGTSDATGERAEMMGAKVLDCPVPGKMAALQSAVTVITDESLRGPILFTDADTLVGPRWAHVMSATARAQRLPVVALGNAVFSHGDSQVADLIRNVRKVAIAQRNVRQGRRGLAQGANLAIDFADSEAALTSFLSIDAQRFIGEEEEIVARILACGGEWRNALSRDATVVTRGDRFGVRDLWRLRHDRDFSQRRARYAEYGPIRPYAASPVAEAAPTSRPLVGLNRRRVA